MSAYHLFNENDMNSVEEEQLELLWKNHSSYSTLVCNNMGNSSSLEEITGFDNFNSTSLKQHDCSEKPLFSSSVPYILSFEDYSVLPNIPNKTFQYQSIESLPKEIQEKQCNRKLKRVRSYSQTQYHIMAERKRREDLARMFIALSAVIPGMKKLDKASILKDATDYVKYLQKRVTDLEEQNKKRKIESRVCFESNKSINVNVADHSSWIFDDGLDKPFKTFPKVEARVSARDVLIRVMCEKQKDIALKILAKLEAYNLSIVGSSVLPFGNSMLNITNIAQMNHGFSTTMDDLVKLLIEDLLECCNLQQ